MSSQMFIPSTSLCIYLNPEFFFLWLYLWTKSMLTTYLDGIWKIVKSLGLACLIYKNVCFACRLWPYVKHRWYVCVSMCENIHITTPSPRHCLVMECNPSGVYWDFLCCIHVETELVDLTWVQFEIWEEIGMCID